MKISEPFDYKILTSEGSAELCRLVIESMDDGWTPLGGVSRSDDENYAYFAQAVARFPDDSDEPACFEQTLFNIEDLLKALVASICPTTDSQVPEK